MFDRFLIVFDFILFLFKIAWWQSVGKEMSSWISTNAVLLYAILTVCIPFPFCVRGRMYPFLIIAFSSTVQTFRLMSRDMTKPTKMNVRPEISLSICPVWSEPSLSTWRNLGSLATQWAHREDSDLCWAHTHFVGLVMSCLGSNIPKSALQLSGILVIKERLSPYSALA